MYSFVHHFVTILQKNNLIRRYVLPESFWHYDVWYGGMYCQRVFGTSVAVVCRSCCCHYSILIRPKMRVYLRVFVRDSVTVEMVVVKIWIFCHFRILAFYVAGSVASCHAACFLFVSPVYAWLIDCMQVHSLNAVQRKVSADDVHIIWNELMASVPMNNACILGQSWRTSFHRYRTEVVLGPRWYCFTTRDVGPRWY